MVAGVSGVLADNYYSSVTLTGGSNSSNSLASAEISGVSSGTYKVFNVNGTDQNFYKFDSNDAYVKMYFTNGSTVWRYMPGDQLQVIMGTDESQARNAAFKLKSKDRSDAVSASTNNSYTTLYYTLTADDINDDGSISIFRGGDNWTCRYYRFTVVCQRWGTDISVLTNNADYGTASFKVNSVTGNSNVSLNTDVVSASVGQPANVTFTASPTSGKLFWRWECKEGSTTSYSYSATETVNITSNHTRTAIFVDGIHVRAYSNDNSFGTVNITYGSQSGTDLHVTPWHNDITFTATIIGNNTFGGWYKDASFTELVSSDETYTPSDIQGSDYTLYAKFIKSTDYSHTIGNTDYTSAFGTRSSEFSITKGDVVNGHQTGHMRTFKF